MTTATAHSLLSAGQALLEALKKEELPVSTYSTDFLTCLLLGTAGEDLGKARSLLSTGHAVLEALKREPALPVSAYSSDFAPALLLGIAAQREGTEAPPPAAPPPPPTPVAKAMEAPATQPVTRCPHCGHDFDLCAGGVYRRQPLSLSPSRIAIEEPAEEVKAPAGCIHVGSDGKCKDCTEDETLDCSACEATIIADKAHRCKNFDDCEHAYCDECEDDNLSKHGYCEDCGTITCDRCEADVTAGEEKHCSNPDCKEEDDFCEECGARLLNAAGLCSDCSKEDEFGCDDCNNTFTGSKVAKCKNFDDCEHAYCTANCAESNLTGGLCEECA